MVGNQTLLWTFPHNKCFTWRPKKRKKPKPCACTHFPDKANHADAPEAMGAEASLGLKHPSHPCAQGKGCRPDGNAVTPPITPEREPHGWWWYESGGVYSWLTSFPSGVCRDDGSPGVLDSINANCPVIMYSIPIWVILTDDGYFLCFPPLFACCKADLEVAVRTSASWESSDCCTGVNDCNIWVWLRSPPGCSSLCCYSRWLGHWPRQATVSLWSSHHWRQLERTSSFHNGWNMILQPVLCSPLIYTSFLSDTVC